MAKIKQLQVDIYESTLDDDLTEEDNSSNITPPTNEDENDGNQGS